MDISRYFSKVFLWMFIGLAVTFVTGQVVANSPALVAELNSGWYIFIAILQFVAVIFLSARIRKMQPTTAKITFIVYSILTGLTFSSIFIVFKVESIIYVFLATSILMLIFALIGYYTKLDLTKIGTFLLIGIFSIIIISIINMFIGNEGLNLGLCIISTLLFIGYIAYDVQKIKQFYYSNSDDDNLAILGALELYLDFINIFIDLLQLFGDNK